MLRDPRLVLQILFPDHIAGLLDWQLKKSHSVMSVLARGDWINCCTLMIEFLPNVRHDMCFQETTSAKSGDKLLYMVGIVDGRPLHLNSSYHMRVKSCKTS